MTSSRRLASQEWEIVTTPTKGTEYPERAGYRENHPTWCRVPVKLDEMMETMESKCNDGLRKAGHPEMIKEELVAGRLYACCLLPCPPQPVPDHAHHYLHSSPDHALLQP